MDNPLFKPRSYSKTIEKLDPNERVLCIVYQHPVGIILIYLMAIFGVIAAFLLLSIYMSSLTGDNQSAYSLLALSSIVIAIMVGLLMVVATIVYKRNKLTVTERSVIQVLQTTLLLKKVSQISLANVEDVTVEQKGVLANMLDFGTLKIETAGEQANFNFIFCQSPSRVAKIILDAKDEFIISTGQAGSYRNKIRSQNNNN